MHHKSMHGTNVRGDGKIRNQITYERGRRRGRKENDEIVTGDM